MTEISDEKIMLQVQEGSISELAELFERYHVRIYNFFLKLTLDKQVSEDLTQNVFLRVIRYRHTYKQRSGTFKTWLYQMARNIHADYYRHEKKLAGRFKRPGTGTRGMEEYSRRGEGFENETADIMDEVYQEDQFEKLDKALCQLTPLQKEIIILSRYQGLRYTEIGRIRNMSVAAIKVQVHRAMKDLRDLYFKQ